MYKSNEFLTDKSFFILDLYQVPLKDTLPHIMEKIYYEEVAKCSSDGKLQITDKEALEEYSRNLRHAPQTISKMEELISLGSFCIKQDYESEALDIFRAAYFLLTPLECSNDRKLQYAHTIYQSFCTLSNSDSEYIWECTGEYIIACREFINGICPGTFK